MTKFFILLISNLIVTTALANEGMWLPALIENQVIKTMQTEGLTLDADDIYNVNQACLKDAIALFGTGCTASFISDSGLLLTNHHCSYSYINALSSIDNNYLKDGFWAMSRNEEIPITGLTVSVLKYMKDVTSEVLKDTNDSMSYATRRAIIRANASYIEKQLCENDKYIASVNSFYNGNQYFAFVSMEYNDVRWVGSPPLSIGNFGKETDNWMWPRHSGDFSLFRVYAKSDNAPAFYNHQNKAFHPQKSIPISLKGYQANDFVWMYGYPANTDLYAPSYKLKMLVEDTYPIRIGARNKKLDVMHQAMQKDEGLYLKYASKAKTVSNSWKRWQGEIKNAYKNDIIEHKIEEEQELMAWIKQSDKRTAQFGNLFEEYQKLYETLTPITIAHNVLYELIVRNGMETVSFADMLPSVSNLNDERAKSYLALYIPRIRKHFNSIDIETDKLLTYQLLQYYIANTPSAYILPSLLPKHNNTKTLQKQIDKLFKNSNFADSTKLFALITLPPEKIEKALQKDAATILKQQLSHLYYDRLNSELKTIQSKIDSLDRLYIQALISYKPNKTFPPDANSTLRVAYGKIEGYQPRDGVVYNHYTTIEGIMQKSKTNNTDYAIPDKLKMLYETKNYGNYANENGTLPVCFTASIHSTGGNSGSAVLNDNGEIIGLNFDRSWDGIISDMYYIPATSRNISVDMRYVLFIIDKFAGANYLLNEMNIIN